MNKTKKRLTLTQRKLINAAIIIIAILIIVGMNFLVKALDDRFSLEKDITSAGYYSLNDTTEEYLKYLEQEINITVLMPEDTFVNTTDDMGSSAYYYQANELLEQMSTYKSVNLEYWDISTTSQSVLEKKYPDADWTSSDNLIVVEYEDKYEVLTVTDIFVYDNTYQLYYGYNVISSQSVEQEVLRAIQKLVSGESFKVAISVGNGEFLNESSTSYSSFSAILSLLDYNAYEVVNINLLTEELTDDYDALIMMAPYVDITNDQSEKINTWLINGGNYGKTFMYVPFDYIDSSENIDLFLEQWGMKVQNGYIIENNDSMTALTNEPYGYAVYANDTYTAELNNTTLSVYMPFSMGVEITDDTVASPLLTSSEDAVLRVLGKTGEEMNTGAALNYAAIGTKGNDDLSKSSNVIVWGSYDSLRYDNMTLSNYNNASYVLNMFNTALGNDTEGIVVESVSLSVETITVSAAQKTAILVIFVFVIPVAVCALGIVIWVRRKNK